VTLFSGFNVKVNLLSTLPSTRTLRRSPTLFMHINFKKVGHKFNHGNNQRTSHKSLISSNGIKDMLDDGTNPDSPLLKFTQIPSDLMP
jgi:hypothetical protein